LTVVGLIASIEEQLGCSIADDEISADIFETVGALSYFISYKMT
jgi:acyl carrier protein